MITWHEHQLTRVGDIEVPDKPTDTDANNQT